LGKDDKQLLIHYSWRLGWETAELYLFVIATGG